MSLAALIRNMATAGATPEAIALAVEAIEEIERKAAAGREVARDRKRAQRARSRDSHGTVTGQSVDGHATLPETKVSPTPPSKTQTIHTPSPPKGGSVPTKLAFDTFWLAYPRKVGKADARKAFDRAWRKLPPFEEEVILCGGLERAKASWTDAQFIPHAATWLNGERWTDEPEPPRKADLSPFAKWQIATGRA